MVEPAFTEKSPDGKLSFAAYVAAVRETVDYEVGLFTWSSVDT